MECTTLSPIVKHCTRCSNGRRYTCLRCGKEYKAKKKDRDTFCSRGCAFAWVRENPVLGPQPAPEPMPVCEICGQPAKNRSARTCGNEDCIRQRYLRLAEAASERDRSPRPCKECERVFSPEYGNKHTRYCSDKCGARAARKAAREKHGGSLDTAARKKLRAMHGESWRSMYEPINKLRVFARDKWKCQLCGSKVKQCKEWNPRRRLSE